jgi:hypothetical protein
MRVDHESESAHIKEGPSVPAKGWSGSSIRSAVAHLGGHTLDLTNLAPGNVWQGAFQKGVMQDGIHVLSVDMIDSAGSTARDEIRIVYGRSRDQARERKNRDQDNAVEAWPERGLLGTEPGPHKNGRQS